MLVKCLKRDWIHEVKSIGKLSLLKRGCLGVKVWNFGWFCVEVQGLVFIVNEEGYVELVRLVGQLDSLNDWSG